MHTRTHAHISLTYIFQCFIVVTLVSRFVLYNDVCAADVHARCEAGRSTAQSAGQCSVQGGSAGECLTLHVYLYSISHHRLQSQD